MCDSQRYAVVVIANDTFIDYVIPFLESFRESNPILRLIVIPFDHSFDKIRLLSLVYDFEIYDDSFVAIDQLSAFLFSNEHYLKNRLRKLIAFELDLDEFLYIDTDIIVQQSLGMFFGLIRPGEIDLIYLVNAGAVYKSSTEGLLESHHSEKFSSGLFVSSNRVTRVEEISRVMRSEKSLFSLVRVEHLYDQPLMNFFFYVTGRKACRAQNLSIPAVYSGVFSDPTIWISPDGHAMKGWNSRVTLTHWAGPKKFRSNRVLPYISLLKPLVERAKLRFGSIPELAEWAPFYESARARRTR